MTKTIVVFAAREADVASLTAVHAWLWSIDGMERCRLALPIAGARNDMMRAGAAAVAVASVWTASPLRNAAGPQANGLEVWMLSVDELVGWELRGGHDRSATTTKRMTFWMRRPGLPDPELRRLYEAHVPNARLAVPDAVAYHQNLVRRSAPEHLCDGVSEVTWAGLVRHARPPASRALRDDDRGSFRSAVGRRVLELREEPFENAVDQTVGWS